MKFVSTAATALLILTLTTASQAQVPGSTQVRCITDINSRAAKVAKTQASEVKTCLKNAAKGKEADPQGCLTRDDKGKVSKAGSKTTESETRYCSDAPPFGFSSAATANTAAVEEENSLAADVFGSNLNTSIVLASSDKTASKCQQQVHKAYEKSVATALKLFYSCKKSGLSDESIASDTALTTCLDTVALDASGKLAKAQLKLADAVTKRCPGVDLALTFPGDCAAAGDFAACVGERIDCAVCRMLQRTDLLSGDCDDYDNAAADGSCVTPGVSTTTTTTTTTTSTTTTTVANGCPTANFLDVASAPGPGGSYPGPTLSVSCTADEVVVNSNAIPHYEFVPVTPNDLVEDIAEYRFPLAPALAAQTSDIPLLGVAAIAVNGIPIFGANEAQTPDPYGDPVANGIMDECYGHTSQTTYHFHALEQKCLIPSGLVSQPWNNADPPSNEASPVLGYALDGFPIYGPYGCADGACSSVIEYRSSWDNISIASGCTSDNDCANNFVCALVMDNGTEFQGCVPNTYAWDNNQYAAKAGAEYLDECNGHTGPGGDYHYHATATFPYTLGCFSGTADGGGGGGNGACTNDADCTGECPAGSQGCVCTTNAQQENICAPTCTVPADCPAGQSWNCANGICRPAQ